MCNKTMQAAWVLREGAPVTERLLRSLRGTASCVGDGVALRPYTVPASLALVPSALPRLSIRPSAEARALYTLALDLQVLPLP